MIEFHGWDTPNNMKVAILLEEAELDYEVRPVDLPGGAHKQPDFLAMNPNGKTPVIVDRDMEAGEPIFESCAILVHLAEKSGRFLPTAQPGRARTLQWVFWEAAELGPALTRFYLFASNRSRFGEATARFFMDEAVHLMETLDTRLGQSAYVAGPQFSIADIATYPPVVRIRERLENESGKTFPNVAAWEKGLALRPALARAIASLEASTGQ